MLRAVKDRTTTDYELSCGHRLDRPRPVTVKTLRREMIDADQDATHRPPKVERKRCPSCVDASNRGRGVPLPLPLPIRPATGGRVSGQ